MSDRRTAAMKPSKRMHGGHSPPYHTIRHFLPS
jgi:hypothetical protein